MIEHIEYTTYKILFGDFMSLEEEVNEYLKNGWKLQGGLASKGSEFIQAMVMCQKVTKIIETEVTPNTFKENFGYVTDKTLFSATMLALEKLINRDYQLDRAIKFGSKERNYPSTQDIKELIIKGAPVGYLEHKAFIDARKRDIDDPLYEPNKV